MKKSFNTAIVGAVSSVGSENDENKVSGLSKVLVEVLQNGPKGYENKIDFFTELESLGAIISFNDGRQTTELSIRVPWNNLKQAKKLLKLSLEQTDLDEKELKNAKNRVRMEKEQLASDPRSLGSHKFLNQVLNMSDPYGTSRTFENISVDLVKARLKELSKKVIITELTESKALDIIEKRNFNQKTDLKSESTHENIIFLDRDIPQKVMYWGMQTESFSKYDFWIALVAGNVLHRPFGGMVFEEIREKNSAAYYAFVSGGKSIKRGVFYISTGVSEKNVTKALKIIYEIREKVLNGDFDEYIKKAKNGASLRIAHYYDNPDSLNSLLNKFVITGTSVDKLPTYSEAIDKINKVTKEQILKYFSRIFSEFPKFLLVGKVSDQIKTDVKEIIKNG